MATYTSPAVYAGALRRREATVRRSVLVTHEENVERTKQEARRLASGHVSSRTLTLLGHPFGRGYAGYSRASSGFLRRYPPKVAIAPLPINTQTGELLRSLRVFRRSIGGATAFQIQFTSPHAIAVRPGGTRRVIDRGFWQALRAFYEPMAHKRNIEALRAANRAA